MNYLLEGQGPLRDIIDSLSNYMADSHIICSI